MRTWVILAVLACAVLLPWREADAYIDPGTGSYMLQLIIAALVGAAISVKVFFHRIRSAVGSVFRGKRKEVPAGDDR